MRRFLFKSTVFLTINVAVATLFLAAVDCRYRFQPWETDSILLATPRNATFDFVLMGTSRARVFTRIKCNYDYLAREMGRVFSVAIPFGGGIVPEKIYLENFFREGNRTDAIIYFIDPFTLFSDEPNRSHRLVYYEPLRPWFLWQLVKNDFPPSQILVYIQSKFSYRWLAQTPGSVPCDNQTVLGPIDPEKIQARVKSLYFDGLNEAWFEKYSQALREILELAKRHHCKLVLAFAPTLLGSQPGEYRLLQELTQLRKKYDFTFCDFTDKITDPALYSDYDHLNSNGVETFVTDFLEPELRDGKCSTSAS